MAPPASRTSTRPRNNVDKANQAASSELVASINNAVLPEQHRKLSFDVLLASDLVEKDRTEIWSLLEDNMKDLYAGSSFGWNPDEKQAELFHALSRFILLRQPIHVNGASVPVPGETGASILAYSMFRFEIEEKQNVVYCYELQVRQKLRRSGLGTCMMQQLVSVGKWWQMQKIMLTVFKSNPPARRFYKAIGFDLDPTSPEYVSSDEERSGEDMEEYDYEILSMDVQ